MKRALGFAAAAIGLGLVAGSAAVLGTRAPERSQPIEPVWTEARWPFPIDQWGTGRAFVCQAADCGAKVEVYIRPKIGFCNCATGVSDDAELQRVSDNELVTRKSRARDAGRPIKVGWMYSRSQSYWSSDGETGEGLLSFGFNDECDVVVALARLGNGDPAVLQPAILAFLNTNDMVLWAKKELGLEFIRREW